ncbi:MAG: triacylglycerol lipase [bacterium]|jgi:triacylglycerol lipase
MVHMNNIQNSSSFSLPIDFEENMASPQKEKTPWKGKFNKICKQFKRSADLGVGVLNGVFGDYLDEQDNDLAVPMQFRYRYHRVELTTESLQNAYSNITPKVCILIHGLTNHETIWEFDKDKEKTYGSFLQKDLGYTPIYVRYNSGLHISKNGENFSNILEELLSVYPIPIEEIVIIGHSMGGLVTRSACHQGKEQNREWIQKVKKMFFLGVPHLGAPLEKFGNVVTTILKTVPRPYTKLAGDVLNLRSSGIKDLRFGYLEHDNWEGKNPDELLTNHKTEVPLLESADHYIITGTLTEDPDHIITQWFGDALVRKNSATGKSKHEKHHIPFTPDHHKEFLKIGHLKLTHSLLVYEQIKTWCESTPVQ